MPTQPPPGAAGYTLSENRQRSESPRRESVEIHFPPQSESEYQDSQNGWPYPESRSANFLFLFISAMETSSPRLPDSRFSGLIGFPVGNALFLLLHFMRLFHGAWILFWLLFYNSVRFSSFCFHVLFRKALSRVHILVTIFPYTNLINNKGSKKQPPLFLYK